MPGFKWSPIFVWRELKVQKEEAHRKQIRMREI
jgi:hypothetical protein